MCVSRWLASALVLLTASVLAASSPSPPVIDDCRYADDAAARAAWQPMSGSAAPSVTNVNGALALRLPCLFAGTQTERASWDRKGQLDLGECRGVQFQFHCRDTAPVSYFAIYFQSGDGWYTAPFFPELPGWNTITIDKADTRVEGKPAGWGAIKAIRLSAWRGANTDTEMLVSDLRRVGTLGQDVFVAVVRCDSAAQSRPEEVRSAAQFAGNVVELFQEAGLGCATLSDLNLEAAKLRQARLVVLPHNPTLPDRAVTELTRYLHAGGKLLAFYGLPAPLRPVVKIDAGPFVRVKKSGDFAAMRFAEGAVPGAPASVGQASWNIHEPKPVPGASRVVAEWFDSEGQPTGRAAVVASSNCVEMSHVLLTDDRVNKRRMLLALAGWLVPELWQQTTEAAIARIGSLAGLRSFDEAAEAIAKQGADNARVASLLADASKLREAAVTARSEGRFAEACDRAADAAQRTMDAFCTAQRPQAGEFRAFWCHSAFGVSGLEWDAAIQRLADNGFNAILPNMLWGGVAFYNSKVLPVSPEVAKRGDQIAKCVTAGKARGVQVHVWKVNWNLGRAPQEFVSRMRREGRLQASSKGKEEPWLCPSHPDNQKLEIASMVEVARDYDVDGIHFDYIRYPDGDHCFCAGCQQRFQRAAKIKLRQWPQEVLTNGPTRQAWLDWRRSNITAVVQAVSEQAHAAKPKVKISAAVFRNWPADRDGVGQDWKLWCERGWLDFVCPMDYTENDLQFANWVRQQRGWAGAVPCYPGIGESATRLSLGPDRVIGQIQITRRQQTGGFVIFNYGVSEANDLLPMLGKGITAKP
ncbi:MAG: family 10 glycosylhydrolase [Verrucomicrobia bacterium]|nr:family 10 glycosylhydrolase [Verrucomicrobiota bacterium]